MSRTQDLVVARLRMLAARWGGRPPGAPGAWAAAATPPEPDRAALSDAREVVSSSVAAPGLGLRAIAVLTIVALAVGGWMLVRGWPRQPEASVGPVAAADGTGGWPAAVIPSAGEVPGQSQARDPFSARTASPSAPASVVVHVAGEVRNPGVVVLPPGSRVGDAVAAAGGLRRGGSLGPANLARVLTDGERIEIGPNPPAPEPASGPGPGPGSDSGAAGALVDLNTATAGQLDALPGIGPVTAAKILAWRAEHGRFSVIDELAEVPGIGPRTLEELRPHVRV